MLGTNVLKYTPCGHRLYVCGRCRALCDPNAANGRHFSPLNSCKDCELREFRGRSSLCCPKAGCGKFYSRTDLSEVSAAQQLYERDRLERKRLSEMYVCISSISFACLPSKQPVIRFGMISFAKTREDFLTSPDYHNFLEEVETHSTIWLRLSWYFPLFLCFLQRISLQSYHKRGSYGGCEVRSGGPDVHADECVAAACRRSPAASRKREGQRRD